MCFRELEERVATYKDIGTVIVTGDMNSRTGVSKDFIQNDRLGEFTARNVSNVFQYMSGTNLLARQNEDNVVNTFGRKLLDLCKASGLRIVNGRHPNDPNGSVTFYNSIGYSLIDYVLIDEPDFDCITSFKSGEFNEFSDNSPVMFSIKIKVHLNNDDIHQVSNPNESTLKWNKDNGNNIKEEIRLRLPSVRADFHG